MIERQVFGGETLAAVLAGVFIPRINVCPRKLNAVPILDSNVLDQPADGGELNGKSYAMDLAIVFIDHLYFSSEQQRERFSPRDNSEWLVRGVQ